MLAKAYAQARELLQEISPDEFTKKWLLFATG
jgi:hypothetical protein